MEEDCSPDGSKEAEKLEESERKGFGTRWFPESYPVVYPNILKSVLCPFPGLLSRQPRLQLRLFITTFSLLSEICI